MRTRTEARTRGMAFILVGALVAMGSLLALTAGSDTTWGDLGLALVSGGIVGGALVLIEHLLAEAADKRSAATALRWQLISTTQLNGIDLTDCDLTGIYLPGKDLVAARFRGTRLVGALLYYADLRYADLRNADLTGADLSGCTLRGADLTGATLARAVLNDTDLRDARFDGADLRGAQVLSVRATGTSFRDAQLDGCSIADANLVGADLVADGLESVQWASIDWDDSTAWPPDFTRPEARPVSDHDLSGIGLAEYLARRRGGGLSGSA